MVAPGETAEESHEGSAEVWEVAVFGVFGDVSREGEGEDLGKG